MDRSFHSTQYVQPMLDREIYSFTHIYQLMLWNLQISSMKCWKAHLEEDANAAAPERGRHVR